MKLGGLSKESIKRIAQALRPEDNKGSYSVLLKEFNNNVGKFLRDADPYEIIDAYTNGPLHPFDVGSWFGSLSVKDWNIGNVSVFLDAIVDKKSCDSMEQTQADHILDVFFNNIANHYEEIPPEVMSYLEEQIPDELRDNVLL